MANMLCITSIYRVFSFKVNTSTLHGREGSSLSGFVPPHDMVEPESVVDVMLFALVKITLTADCTCIFGLCPCYFNSLCYDMHMCCIYAMVVDSGRPCTQCQLGTCILSVTGYLHTILTLWQMQVHTFVYL